MIGKLMKKNLVISHDKMRFRPKKSEVNRLLSKNTKAKKLLKWKPKLYNKKGLNEGLKLTIDWFEKTLMRLTLNLKFIISE